jgi:hypothetical protein
MVFTNIWNSCEKYAHNVDQFTLTKAIAGFGFAIMMIGIYR